MAMAIAVLALAGCGEGKSVDASQGQTATVTGAATQTGAIALPGSGMCGWYTRHKLQAITDPTAWLLEHGFNFYIVKTDGKDEVLLGPFATKEQAEASKRNSPKSWRVPRKTIPSRNHRAQGRAIG
jgi:hypothetical protein